MSQPPPTWPEDSSIIDDPPHRLRPTMFQAISRKVALQNKQPTGLISGLLQPTVTSAAAAGEAGGVVPVCRDGTGKEITHHEAVRRSDAGGRKYNTNTAWRFVRCDGEGGSPAAASGVNKDTDAAISRYFSYGAGAADPQHPQQRETVEQCQTELAQRLYTISGDPSKATGFVPLPRPVLTTGGSLLSGSGQPSRVQPAAALAPAAPSGAGPATTSAIAMDAPPLHAHVARELQVAVGAEFPDVARCVGDWLRARQEFKQLTIITAKDVAELFKDKWRVADLVNQVEESERYSGHLVHVFIKRVVRLGKALRKREVGA